MQSCSTLQNDTLELLGCSGFSRRPSLPDPNISMSPYVLPVCHLHPRQAHPWRCTEHGKNARTKNVQQYLSFWIPKSKTGMPSTWMPFTRYQNYSFQRNRRDLVNVQDGRVLRGWSWTSSAKELRRYFLKRNRGCWPFTDLNDTERGVKSPEVPCILGSSQQVTFHPKSVHPSLYFKVRFTSGHFLWWKFKKALL